MLQKIIHFHDIMIVWYAPVYTVYSLILIYGLTDSHSEYFLGASFHCFTDHCSSSVSKITMAHSALWLVLLHWMFLHSPSRCDNLTKAWTARTGEDQHLGHHPQLSLQCHLRAWPPHSRALPYWGKPKHLQHFLQDEDHPLPRHLAVWTKDPNDNCWSASGAWLLRGSDGSHGPLCICGVLAICPWNHHIWWLVIQPLWSPEPGQGSARPPRRRGFWDIPLWRTGHRQTKSEKNV